MADDTIDTDWKAASYDPDTEPEFTVAEAPPGHEWLAANGLVATGDWQPPKRPSSEPVEGDTECVPTEVVENPVWYATAQ